MGTPSSVNRLVIVSVPTLTRSRDEFASASPIEVYRTRYSLRSGDCPSGRDEIWSACSGGTPGTSTISVPGMGPTDAVYCVPSTGRLLFLPCSERTSSGVPAACQTCSTTYSRSVASHRRVVAISCG